MSSNLSKIISGLLLAARQKANVPFRRQLPNGLRIDVKHDGESVYVQLSRLDKSPSMVEYQTVLNHWPEPLSVMYSAISRISYHGRHYMKFDYMEVKLLI